jgi:hypothetical protein
MPRQARLDAPGTLHHVILRGMERGRIVTDREDCAMFLARLGEVALATGTTALRLGAPPESRPPAAPEWGPGAAALHAPTAHGLRAHVQPAP